MEVKSWYYNLVGAIMEDIVEASAGFEEEKNKTKRKVKHNPF